jgi:biotin operon repressor
MRTDEALAMLKKQGEKGISTEEFGKKFGFQNPGSISKTIGQLRATGYDITYNKDNAVYVLKNNKADTVESASVTPIEEEPKKDASTPSTYATKKELILEALLEAGKEGANVEYLAKMSGVNQKNVCFHVHSLRKIDGCKISMIEGRYILKNRPKKPSALQQFPSDVVPPEIEGRASIEELFSSISDRSLIAGINKINPEDRRSYLELLKKVIYYKKCALSMLETTNIINSINVGVI